MFKKRARNKNVRIRETETEDPELIVNKKSKTKEAKRYDKDETLGYHKAETSPSLENINTATASSEYNTDKEHDARNLLEKKLEKNEYSETYKGKNYYATFIEKKENIKGSVASQSIGPVRAPSNLRATSRFDYAPDVCKDYKETGFCGFGITCKFLHDRSDMKSGWELEKEFEANQAKFEEDEFEVHEPVEDLTCPVCHKEGTVQANCGCRYCQTCGLELFKAKKKCLKCDSELNGQFKVIKKKKV